MNLMDAKPRPARSQFSLRGLLAAIAALSVAYAVLPHELSFFLSVAVATIYSWLCLSPIVTWTLLGSFAGVVLCAPDSFLPGVVFLSFAGFSIGLFAHVGRDVQPTIVPEANDEAD
jgi:hypothetical protein